MLQVLKSNGKKNELTGIKKSLATHPVIYGAFCSFVVCAGFFFLLIVPAVRSFEAGGSASVASAREKIVAAQKTLDDENKMIEIIASLTDDERKKIDYALPAEPDSSGALVQLAALAKSAGGTVDGIDFSIVPDSSPGSLKKVGFMDISVNIGRLDYGKIKILLSNIEHNLRIIDVKNFVFAGQPDSSVSMNLRTYYLK